ncbi:MAG: DUF5597 domain-containing protein [Bacteroidales bacterium]|nr:DUF5597 domain-containing protein [Bacteroidales bacterium]
MAQDYRILTPLANDLARWQQEGRIHAVVESESHEDQTMDLGHWEAIIKFEAKSGKGRAMVITLAPDELLLVFTDCRFNIQGKGTGHGDRSLSPFFQPIPDRKKTISRPISRFPDPKPTFSDLFSDFSPKNLQE